MVRSWTPHRWARRALVLGACLAWSAPSSARAEEDEDTYATAEAREAYQAGVDAMEAGDCAAAVPHFERALALHTHYQIAGNLGACELELKRYRRAAEHLQLALDELRKAQGRSEQIGALEQMLERTALHVGILRVSVSGPGAADATITLDGEPIAANTTVFVPPGEHELVARSPEGIARPVTVRIRAGERLTQVVTLVPGAGTWEETGAGEPPAAAGEDDAPSAALSIAMWSSYGLAVAVTAVGAGLYAAGAAAQDDADARRDALRAGGGCAAGCPELVGLYADADEKYNAAAGMFVAGGALLVAGTVLLILDVTMDDAPEIALVPMSLGAHGVAGGLVGRF